MSSNLAANVKEEGCVVSSEFIKKGYYWSEYHNKYVSDDPDDISIVYWNMMEKKNCKNFYNLNDAQTFIDTIQPNESIFYIYFEDNELLYGRFNDSDELDAYNTMIRSKK
jgi:hypothetical protein